MAGPSRVASMSPAEFLDHLLQMVDDAGSQAELARRLGLSTGHLSEVINGKSGPGEKLLAALGLERVAGVRYQKSGNGGGGQDTAGSD